MKTKSKKIVKKYLFIWSILIYPAALFLIFYVGVNFNSLLLAFQKIDGVSGAISFARFDNFKEFFKMIAEDMLFQKSIINSLLMYVICLVISFPLMIFFSFYVYKKFRLSKYFRTILMVPAVVSSFIMCLLFQKFIQVGMPAFFKQYFSLEIPKFMADPKYTFGTSIFYMIWISFSNSILLIPNAMKEVPDEVLESAEIDGVGYFQELWYIILPLIMPTLSTFVVVGIAAIFSNAGPIHAFYNYSAYPEVYNVGYYILQKTMTNSANDLYPLLSAMGIMFTVVLAPLTIFVKWLLERLDPAEDKAEKSVAKLKREARKAI